jgi:type I restriction enzyme, R subunit
LCSGITIDAGSARLISDKHTDQFQREGIKYDELSEEEQERWDAIEWDEDGNVPRTVEPEALNRWLFNKDTVDKVLEHVMTRGMKVADGDRLGKTIIFAKNHDLAQFIVERFRCELSQVCGSLCKSLSTFRQSMCSR